MEALDPGNQQQTGQRQLENKKDGSSCTAGLGRYEVEDVIERRGSLVVFV